MEESHVEGVATQGDPESSARTREVKGSPRWQLAGQISAGYLMSHVVKEGFASAQGVADRGYGGGTSIAPGQTQPAPAPAALQQSTTT